MRKININPTQIMTTTISATLGLSILTIQHDLVMIANQDAWISMLAGSIIAIMISIFATYNLAKLYPKNDFPQITILILGKAAGRIVISYYLISGLIAEGTSLRIFVHTLKSFLLDQTPVNILIIFIAVGVITVVKRGLNAIMSSVDIMFPVFLFPLIFLIILPFSRVDIGNIRPVMFENTYNVLKGMVPSVTVFIGCGFVNYAHPYISDIKGIFRWLLIGMLASAIIYVGITIITITIFGTEEIKTLMYPTLILSKSIEFPATLFERLETLILIVWIPGFFAWMTLYSYAMVRNTCEIFNLKPKYYKHIAYALLPILSIIAVVPKNGIAAHELISFVGKFNAFGFTILVPVISAIGFIKKRRNKLL